MADSVKIKITGDSKPFNDELDKLGKKAKSAVSGTGSVFKGIMASQIVTKGVSKTVLSGEAASIKASGANSSEVDAVNLPVKSAEVNLVNSSCYTVNATERLKLDVVGGSTLYFNSQPVIEIVRILNSSVRHYGDSRK